MSFLVFATPLLKVPLLLSAAACAYGAMTPPLPPPPTEDQSKYTQPDFLSNNFDSLIPIVTGTRWSFAALSLAEAAVILAQHFPCALSDRVLSLLWRPHAGALGLTPTTLAGALLTLGAGLLRVYCYRTLGRHFTYQLAVLPDHKLVTAGPYALVRHPSYTAWGIVAVGETLMAFSPGSYFARRGLWRTLAGKLGARFLIAWMAFVWVEMVRRVPKEDAAMRREFGARWEAWAGRTYRLVPFVY